MAAKKQVEAIVALAKQRAVDKERIVLATIKELRDKKIEITFSGVAKAAGVSTNYLYKNPKLRETIVKLREGQNVEPDVDSANTVIAALKSRIKELEQQVKELERDELWKAKYERKCEEFSSLQKDFQRLLGKCY